MIQRVVTRNQSHRKSLTAESANAKFFQRLPSLYLVAILDRRNFSTRTGKRSAIGSERN